MADYMCPRAIRMSAKSSKGVHPRKVKKRNGMLKFRYVLLRTVSDCREHGVVFMPHESDLILQCCRLLRGFTHPQTYFGNKDAETVTPYSVEEFRMKVNQLLALTLDAGD